METAYRLIRSKRTDDKVTLTIVKPGAYPDDMDDYRCIGKMSTNEDVSEWVHKDEFDVYMKVRNKNEQ